MKFGKELRNHLEETLPEWRDKFLCYKPLKKLLKNIHLPDPDDHQPPQITDYDDHQPLTRISLEEWFVRILDEELEKFNDFYVEKEEEFVIRLQELKDRIEKVKEKSNRNGIFTRESEFSEEMLDIRKDFVSIHGEMVLLKNYSSLNFAGLVKILKKYDKRTGGLLRLPFTQRALHQPFFTTEPLTRLVHECEANLELLFPLKAEVIESTSHDEQHDRVNSPSYSQSNHTVDASSSVNEDTYDIYRSILAAIRTIQGLRRASSTYNPLSFPSFYQNHGNDSTGAVTTENSACNSPTTARDGTDRDNAESTDKK
ncbi:hypothetical protein Syun_021558 [Stephania yunnanensis]|uniref:SPX domain-containing protein n=1 Tax=Stephania yunnanensis TaxID=152371 RepID=A0AAP0NSD5_9MAGN